MGSDPGPRTFQLFLGMGIGVGMPFPYYIREPNYTLVAMGRKSLIVFSAYT